jgi:hypothetical protein
MLKYGLQKLHLKKMDLPGSRRNYPDKIILLERYQRFRDYKISV